MIQYQASQREDRTTFIPPGGDYIVRSAVPRGQEFHLRISLSLSLHPPPHFATLGPSTGDQAADFESPGGAGDGLGGFRVDILLRRHRGFG